MSIKFESIKPIRFTEPEVKSTFLDDINEFDITTKHQPFFKDFKHEGKFSHDLYCRFLILGLYKLPKRKRIPLLEYQLASKENKLKWITEVEELFYKNETLFKNSGLNEFYEDIIQSIPGLIELINLRTLDPDINFKEPNGKALGLDLKQTSILFSYLMEKDVILKYDNTSLAKLIHHLTGHSEQNLRTIGLAHLYSIKKEVRKNTPYHNLIAVRSLLEGLLAEIKSEIK